MIWPAFKSEGRFEHERGTIFTVTLQKSYQDFSELFGEVLIDGELWNVIGVERFAHMPPWGPGEQVGLLVKPST